MIEWEWDPEKDKLNRLNHRGLGLAAGAAVFADPLAASRLDPSPGEMRWQTIDSAGGIAVLFVVHNRAGGAARRQARRPHHQRKKATPHERKAYEDSTF